MRFETASLLHLSTVAAQRNSNQPWVKFQSAGWVNIQSAPTQLTSLLCAHKDKLQNLISSLEQESKTRTHASLRMISELLIDAAAYRTQVIEKDEDEVKRRVSDLQSKIRNHEQKCVDALLAIYRFDRDDIELRDFSLLSGRLEDDLFNPEVLKQTAKRLGLAATIGALVGLAADLAVAGISLGAGAAVGGAVGGMLARTWGKGSRWVKEKINGYIDLTVDDATLLVLLGRQLQLLTSLQGRTHAASEILVLDEDPSTSKTLEGIIKMMRSVRGHPTWSQLADDFEDESHRDESIDLIAESFALQERGLNR